MHSFLFCLNVKIIIKSGQRDETSTDKKNQTKPAIALIVIPFLRTGAKKLLSNNLRPNPLK